MARNEDKSRSMLNMYLKRHEVGRVQDKRPVHTAFVNTTIECEKWLRQVTQEIIQEVGLIQNATLGETKIREKNDLINKLIRERRFWEKRIIELSGFDYAEKLGIDCHEERLVEAKRNQQEGAKNAKILTGDFTSNNNKKRNRNQQYLHNEQFNNNDNTNRMGNNKFKGQVAITTRSLKIDGDFDSKDVIGVDGYFYFGAAKSLPGVRELYEKSNINDTMKIKKRDLKLRANAHYFGFEEEYDHQLLREEAEIENAMLIDLIQREENGESLLPITSNILYKNDDQIITDTSLHHNQDHTHTATQSPLLLLSDEKLSKNQDETINKIDKISSTITMDHNEQNQNG